MEKGSLQALTEANRRSNDPASTHHRTHSPVFLEVSGAGPIPRRTTALTRRTTMGARGTVRPSAMFDLVNLNTRQRADDAVPDDITSGPTNLIFRTLALNKEAELPPSVVHESAEEMHLHVPYLLKKWKFFTGTMWDCQQKVLATNNRLIVFIDSVLRGSAQGIAQNNPMAGFLVLVAVFVSSFPAGFLCLIGVLFATLTAHLIGLDINATRNGFFGSVGLDLGLLLHLFHFKQGPTLWSLSPDVHIFILTAVLSCLSTFVIVGMSNIIVRTFKLSPLGLPFALCSYMWVLACSGGQFAYFSIDGSVINPSIRLNPLVEPDRVAPPYDTGKLFETLLTGIGNMLFQENMYSGAIVLFATFMCSPIACLMMCIGVMSALGLPLAFGMEQSVITGGMLQSNLIFTALGLGGYFIVLRGWKVWLYLAAGLLLTFLLSAAFRSAFAPLGCPVLSLPGDLATWIIISCARHVPGIMIVPLEALSVPENHRKLIPLLDIEFDRQSVKVKDPMEL